MKKIILALFTITLFASTYPAYKYWDNIKATVLVQPFTATELHSFWDDTMDTSDTLNYPYFYEYQISCRNRSITADSLMIIQYGLDTLNGTIDYSDVIDTTILAFNYGIYYRPIYYDTLGHPSMLWKALHDSCATFKQINKY